MTTPRTWGLLATTAVVSIVLVVLPGTARPAYPGFNGKIAFASERDGDFEIYVMEPDGSGQTRLTNNPADDREPAWSADGSTIAFARNFEIWVMDASGSGERQLTNNARGDETPAWSPDGSKLAFTRYGGPFGAIYVVNANGSGGETPLTSGLEGNAFDPDWSPVQPDGSSRIAFARTENVGPSEIYVMNPDGSGQVPLTDVPGVNDFAPSWSPDGKQIAFVSERDGNAEIYVMNADGSEQTRLTNNAALDAYPAWSPDGLQIAFARGNFSSREIWVMNADGSGQTRLTDNFDRDDYADWQPLSAPPLPLQARLTVLIQVVNDDGGSRTAADWTVTVTGTNAVPASFPGAGPPGTTVTLDPGAYTVSQSGPAGYDATPSADCAGTIAAGETRTCTFVNDDRFVAVITVGASAALDFGLVAVGASASVTGSLVVEANVPYTITVNRTAFSGGDIPLGASLLDPSTGRGASVAIPVAVGAVLVTGTATETPYDWTPVYTLGPVALRSAGPASATVTYTVVAQ